MLLLPLSSQLRTAEGRRLEKFKNKHCTAVLVDAQYQANDKGDPGDQHYLACLTDDGKAYKVQAANQHFLKNNFGNGAFKSGETDLTFGNDAVLDPVSNEILSKHQDLPRNPGNLNVNSL